MAEIYSGLSALPGSSISCGLANINPYLNTTVMKKNMGSADRIIRTFVALLVAVLYFTGVISGTVAIVLGVLAVIFLLTSLVGTCPLYLPVGLSTKKDT